MDSEVLKYRALLHRQAQRLCGSSAGADDLVQEVYMKYYEKFPDGRDAPVDEPRRVAWLFKTLQNSFRSNLRKKMVREGAVVDPTLEASVTPEESPDPESFMTITDAEFDRALVCLTEKQRRVLELNQQSRPHADIARELDIRVGTVAKRLFDARKRLRAELQRIIDTRHEGRTP